MANETTKVVLDLDNSEFVSKLQESLGLMGEFGQAEGLINLSSKLGELGVLVGVATAAFLALKESVDFVEEAEKIKQVNAAFEDMATSAGLAADVLKNQLVTAAEGLVSETELLQSANKALATMGENASKLPQILEIARKATALFGGDLVTNFNNINQAMATGQVRMLKHYGIVVDLDKATQKYADTINTGTDYLSQADKRQAIFNESLAQATTKFANINVNITETSNSFQRLWTSLKEITESAAILWESLAGPTVRKFVGELAADMHTLSLNIKAAFSHGNEQQENKKKLLEDQVARLKEILATTEKVVDPGQYERYEGMLKKAEQQLELINQQEEKALQLQIHKDQAMGGDKDKAAVVKPVDEERLRKRLEAHQKFEQDLVKLRAERLKSEEKVETDSDKLKAQHDEEKLNLEKAAQLKIIELRKLYDSDKKTKGIISDQEFARATEEVEKKKLADMTAINLKYENDRVQALKNLAAQNANSAKGFTASWGAAGAQAGKDLSSFSKLGETSFKAVHSHASAAFKAMGDGSKSVGDAMKGAMFGALGDIATAQGELFLAQGMGHLAMGAPGGAIEIAEGGALIALGGLLSSMGTGGSSISAGGGGGGGGGSAPSDNISPTAGPTAAPQKKTVNLQIMGHYFETDQTRTRMMDMIRQAGDFTDFNLKQIGQP